MNGGAAPGAESPLPAIEALDPFGFPDPEGWSGAAVLAPLARTEDGRPARHVTIVRVARTEAAFHVRFECAGRDRWCRHVRRDAPLWEEEAVEIFVSPGDVVPRRYVELEVNPAGAIFDAIVDNPEARRETMRVSSGWDAPGLCVRVGKGGGPVWTVEVALPWACLGEGPRCPEVVRANFYRIDRPRGLAPEFAAWSPTLTDPPDFHRPERFGRLIAV